METHPTDRPAPATIGALPGSERVAATGRASEGTTATIRNVLLTLWRGRALPGGLIAVAVGLWGQLALVNEGDTATATRNYIIAFILVIISLAHPTLRLRRRDTALPVETPPAAANSASAPATAPLAARRSIGVVPYDSPAAALPGRPAHAPHAGTGASAPQRAGPWARYVAWRAHMGLRVTLPGVAAAVALAVAAFAVLWQDYASVLGGWLWAASLAALIVALVGARPWPGGAGLLPGPKSDFFAPGVPNMPARLEYALVVLVMVVAAVLRLWNLENHPGVFGDEGERGMDARAILEGDTRPIFGVGWWMVPNMYFYVISAFFRVFGDNLIGDRMVSVVFQMLAVWFVYRTGKLLWGSRAGLIAGAMLAVSPLALQFSRLAGESSVTGALWGIGAFYLFLAFKHRRWSDWALAAFFWSYNLYFYPSGKMIIPLAAAVMLYAVVRWRKEFFRRYAIGFAVFWFVGLLTFMPYGIFSAKENWVSFSGRANETSIFSPQNQATTFQLYGLQYDAAWAGNSVVQNFTANPVAWSNLLYQQTRETLDVLYRRHDQVNFYGIDLHGGTAFQPLWAVLALLGLAYALSQVWDARYGLALIWFAVGISASILTVDTPNLQRFAGAWPVAMLFPAALADRIFAGGWPLSRGFARKWSTVPLALLVIYLAGYSTFEYFVYYPTRCPWCRDTVQARYVQGFGDEFKGYQMGVGGWDVYFTYGSTRFVAKGIEGEDIIAASDGFPITDNNGKGAAFIIYPNNAEYLSILRQYYPEGTEKAQITYTGDNVFTSYEVTLDQLEALRKSSARYTLANGHLLEREERGIGTDAEGWAPPGELAYPARAEWRSGLVVPNYGVYTLAVEGAPGTRLEVDGKPVAEVAEGGERAQGDLVLAKGVHQVLLMGALPSEAAQVRLMWAGAGAPLEPFDTLYLWAGSDGGLLAEVGQPGVPPDQVFVSPNPFAGASPPQRRVDPFVGYREGSAVFGNSVWLARWRGKLLVPSSETYTFTLNSNPPGWIAIDGKTVLGMGPDGQGSGTAQLEQGEHDIDIRYMSQGAPARVEVMWQSQTMQSQIIPPTALRPLERSWRPDEVPGAPGGVVPVSTSGAAVAIELAAVYSEGGLARPRGIAVDPSGNAYVGDRGNGRIVVYSPEGKLLRTWGGPAPAPAEGQEPDEVPVEPGQFFDIIDVAVGADGLVYVLDTGKRVQAFTAEGAHVGSYEPELLGLYAPNGLAAGNVGGRDSILVAVTGQNRLVSLPLIGDVQSGQEPLPDSIRSIAPEGIGALEQPVDVAVDPTGSGLVFAIDLHDRLVQLKQVESGAWAVARQWQLPVGRNDGGGRLAVAPDGSRVYMSDPDRMRVAIIEANRNSVTFFGRQEGEPGSFGGPSGVATAIDGKVYVVDVASANVQVFVPEDK
jgi:DNA-binding beta-propeller fold protein YncE/4-amino-4-deoxy-L-arabinose transferase-like glycosyltransferase